MNPGELLDNLPAAELLRKGLADRIAGRTTPEFCLVEIARPRLELAGLLPPAPRRLDSETTLFRLLVETEPNPYARYNSLLRELSSFEHALDHRMSRRSKAF